MGMSVLQELTKAKFWTYDGEMKSQRIPKVITINPKGKRVSLYQIHPIAVTKNLKCEPHGGARGEVRGSKVNMNVCTKVQQV